MAARRKFSIGNVFFWLVLFGASAGAFGGGFWYTYGATVNVNTKDPSAGGIAARPAKPTPMAKRPAAKATPTAEPGLVAMPSTAPTPTPRPQAPSPSPRQVVQVVGLTPVAEPTPTPAPRRIVPTPAPKQDVYRVHVGGFGDRETAQKQVEELQGAGINAVVVYDEGKYHAQLGAFTDRARALSVADEVNIRGYSVTIRH